MTRIDRDGVRTLVGKVLADQGKELPGDDGVSLRSIGFRSLDFSEAALRLEDESGQELNFAALELRRIETVGDVIDLLVRMQED